MAVVLYSLAKASFGMLGKVSGVSRALTTGGLEAAEALSRPEVHGDIKEMEFDGMWRFIGSKNKLWVIKAADLGTGYRPS